MRTSIVLSLAASAGAILATASLADGRDQEEVAVLEEPPRQEEGQARILASFLFPLFPQYQDIDIGANLNNLKSSDTVAFFIVRDALTVQKHIFLIAFQVSTTYY